ncbi:lactonase family protein [Fictibacillus terranigra]|uniref:Lactonase family protein n=1 Tax=Fictibacillus terranigra TaxID=3058424 RepID=A0ABT8E1B3_9BACL|nr:lactonase family protein [Fictibacillus sp. CENA-BCM004]MDN4071700.1 lactonase family protein [Fictibacillus sp. CENA-BCM004]
MTKYSGYIGTYTKGESKGIYSFTLDTDEGRIADIKAAAQLGNPTYLTISEDNQYLYAVKKDGDMGGVAAYSITNESRGLALLNSQLTEGASPCHVSVDRENRNVLTANYHRGTVERFAVEQGKGVHPATSVIQHKGSGPDERQEKAHTHYAGFTPDEKYVAVVDLGIDKLITYQLNNGELNEVSSLSVKPGSGPRHLEFHPNGKMAYLMTEFSSEVIVLEYNEGDGSFAILQSISTIPEDFTENNQGSAIHVSSDGRFVYAANRGHNSIAIFSVKEESGELTFVDRTSTEGDWPRDFMLDPSGKFIVASNQESGNLVLFSRDENTGKLTLLQSDAFVPYPVCVKFLHVK